LTLPAPGFARREHGPDGQVLYDYDAFGQNYVCHSLSVGWLCGLGGLEYVTLIDGVQSPAPPNLVANYFQAPTVSANRDARQGRFFRAYADLVDSITDEGVVGFSEHDSQGNLVWSLEFPALLTTQSDSSMNCRLLAVGADGDPWFFCGERQTNTLVGVHPDPQISGTSVFEIDAVSGEIEQQLWFPMPAYTGGITIARPRGVAAGRCGEIYVNLPASDFQLVGNQYSGSYQFLVLHSAD
jgi:hypothetical protein